LANGPSFWRAVEQQHARCGLGAGGQHGLALSDRWLRQHLVPSQVRVRVDIFNAVAAMLRTGVGVGVLPSFMQDANPDLLPVSDVIPELSVPSDADPP
jgi:DNA-binding transcriptional LysR family regulator